VAMIAWEFYLHPIMKSVPITLCTSKVMSLIPAHLTCIYATFLKRKKVCQWLSQKFRLLWGRL